MFLDEEYVVVEVLSMVKDQNREEESERLTILDLCGKFLAYSTPNSVSPKLKDSRNATLTTSRQN